MSQLTSPSIHDAYRASPARRTRRLGVVVCSVVRSFTQKRVNDEADR
ncbi:MAG: hypothetical protein HYV09_21790 [Deltaproteobacteria bacterium]|nr:hypothetical protein [Deltaproteobacteria bacterium]